MTTSIRPPIGTAVKMFMNRWGRLRLYRGVVTAHRKTTCVVEYDRPRGGTGRTTATVFDRWTEWNRALPMRTAVITGTTARRG